MSSTWVFFANAGKQRFVIKFFTVLCCLATLTVPGAGESLRFGRLSLDDGLSENSVICILQDSRGFMWFGTGDGLNRYDGYRFTIFRHDPADSLSLGSNYILSILEDRQEQLWVATWQGGLNRYESETGHFMTYGSDETPTGGLKDNSVLSLCEDRHNRFWVGALNGGLNLFDRATGKAISFRNDRGDSSSLSGDIVTVICEDRAGRLWIGTGGGGLNRFDIDPAAPLNWPTGSFKRFQHRPGDTLSLSNDNITAIVTDPEQEDILWLGTRGGGLCRFDVQSESFQRFQHRPGNAHSLRNDLIYACFFDHERQLWAGTFGGGLNRLNADSHSFSRYVNEPANPYSISDDKVISIAPDRSGNLWFGTHKGGISKLNRLAMRFRHYRHQPGNPQSLCGNFITAVYVDQSGLLWIGTQEGLTRLDRGTGEYRHYFHRSGISFSLGHNWVSEIFEDSRGQLWMGTYGGGLNLLQRDTGQFQRYCPTGEDSGHSCKHEVLSIAEHDGHLWVAVRTRGVSKLDFGGKVVRLFKANAGDPDSLSDAAVRQIYPDSEGQIWVATNNGLNCLDPHSNRLSRFMHEPDNSNSLSDNRILSINEDREGILWIGTLNGLNRFDRRVERFTHYLVKDGLPNNVVYAVLEDEAGCLWISTNNGLSKFDPRRETFTNYDASDGLQSNEFNEGAYFCGSDGEIFVGGYNGLNTFYPEQITDNSVLPPVVITDFQLFNQPVPVGRYADGSPSPLRKAISQTDTLRLSYADKVFSLEFAALDFTAPWRNRLAYQLEGFDTDWIYAGRRRFATYTNLDPGTYVFRVKGANNSGIWNKDAVELHLVIDPPYWKTWWFRLLLGVGGVGVIALIFNARLSVLRKENAAREQFSRQLLDTQEQERKRIARELHDGLGQNLLFINNILQLQMAGDSLSGDLRREIAELSGIARESIDEVREISQNLHPHQLERLGLEKAVRSIIDKASHTTDLHFRFHCDSIDKAFDKDLEIHVFRMIQEGINNIVKHSDASEADISISLRDVNICIEIRDNGRGFSPEGKRKNTGGDGNGFGMTGIRERVKFLSGQIRVVSSPGKGCRLTILLPVNR